MQPRMIRTPLGQYTPVEWSSKNESGIEPLGDRVLVLPDPFSPTTTGGIDIPDDVVERHTEAAETGVLVAVGSEAWAWNSDRTRRFDGTKPEVGQRVIFERYAGTYQYGADGKRYRLMDDKCIGGLFAADKAPALQRKPVKPAIAKVTKAPLVIAR